MTEDLKYSLCGRSGHDKMSCQKIMNHVISEVLMKSHPKETARIMHENKQFTTVGPRGTPRQSGERTERQPPSAIRMSANPQPLSSDVAVTVIDTKAHSDAHGMSFDETANIKRVGFDDYGSVNSEESDIILECGPIARIAVCQGVIMGVRYDEQLIDRINANWDEEVTTTHELGTWATVITTT
jgi:hypothetical protein